MWIVLSADWLLTFKEERITFSGTLFSWGFLFFLISPVFKKNQHFLPLFCTLDAPKVWDCIVISDIIADDFCVCTRSSSLHFQTFFALNHRKIYFAVHKKHSGTCCVSHLFSFIRTLTKMCCVFHLGCGRWNLVWCTCWLLKLTSW